MRQVREAVSYIPVVIFALLAAGLFILLYRAWIGEESSAFVTAAASFVLAVVTIHYAWQAQRSNRYTEKTLDEMRLDRAKEGKILVIAHGIDPIRQQLEGHKQSWNLKDSDREPVPNLGSGSPQNPGWTTRRDIDDSSYSSFSDDIDRYLALISDYMEIWDDVHAQLTAEIHTEYKEELNSILPETPQGETEPLAERFANSVLKGTPLRISGAEEVAEDIYQESFHYRENHTEQIDSLWSLIEEIDALNVRIYGKLGEAREDIKSTYNITEFEIRNMKKESNLGPTRVGGY